MQAKAANQRQLLEMICEKLCNIEEEDTVEELLSMRLVSKNWNAIATLVLRRRCLEDKTNWDSIIQTRSNRMYPFSIPRLSLVYESEVSMAYYPQGQTRYDERTIPSLEDHFLFYLMVPNLKALTLNRLKLKGVDALPNGTTDWMPSSPVPTLTHAVLMGGFSVPLSRWLLKLLAHQLTSLYLDYYDGILPLSQPGGDVIPFQQLKNLRFRYESRNFSFSTDFFPSLESLFIDHLLEGLSFEKLVTCLDKLAPTLVEVFVNVEKLNEGNILSLSKLCRAVTFPKLSRLVLHAEDFKSFELVKSHLLPWFTNLKTLLLPEFDDTSEYLESTNNSETQWATEFIDREGLWNLCPTLTTIGIPNYTLYGGFYFHSVMYQTIKRPDAMSN